MKYPKRFNLKKLLATLLLVVCTMSVYARYDTIDGIGYLCITGSGVAILQDGKGCTGDLNIPESFTSHEETYKVIAINDYAFQDNTQLQSVSIPASVTYIGEGAFKGCIGLSTASLPETMAEIGKDTFNGCSDLSTVSTLGAVTEIADGTFSGCTRLTSITIGESVTAIGNEAFNGCSSLTSITIGESVTVIGNSAFEGCSSLTTMTIPDHVTSIGEYAFFECSVLSCVTVGNAVKTIGGYAFGYCSNLEKITIGNSVGKIRSQAFYNCKNLKEVHISDLSAWCNIDFANPDFYNSETNPVGYAHNLYLNDELMTELVIPEDITRIKAHTFYGCSSLKSILIHDSVTEIGNYAFSRCNDVTTMTIGSSVAEIGLHALPYAYGKLTTIYCLNEKPPYVAYNGDDDLNPDVTLYVPKGCVEIYKLYSPWNCAKNIVEIGGGLTGVNRLNTELDDCPTEYYSLDGVKITSTSADEAPDYLPSGTYITRQGSNTSKIIIPIEE